MTNPFPVVWNVVRDAANPVIDEANNPNESAEQYVPAPVKLDNGDVWVYVKGAVSIYAWKSTDGGVTFALQNSNNPVLVKGTAGAWDDYAVVDPVAVFDSANSTIHLWYKGVKASGGLPDATSCAWGHATAPSSTPTVFTKDAGNPILTSATVAAAFGGGAMGDLSLSDVIKIGSTYHFYGFALYASVYRILYATGSSWNNPSSPVSILSAPATWQYVIQKPTVFTFGDVYGMLYSFGGSNPSEVRRVFAAASANGTSWSFNSSTILGPYGVGWEGFEAFAVAVLKESTPPFAAPVTNSAGRWLLYYSGGSATGGKANTGLAYLVPS